MSDAFKPERMRALVGQEEVGESGTRHWQALVCYHKSLTLGGVKKDFPGAHLEVCKDV